MSLKTSSQRSFFEVSSLGTPAEWIRVGGVRAINNVRSGAAAEIDVSDLSSTEKEYILGLADPGSMDTEMMFDPSDPGQVLLAALRLSGSTNAFRVGAPNLNQTGSPTGFFLWTFNGYVQTFPFSLQVDQAQVATVTVRISGAIVET